MSRTYSIAEARHHLAALVHALEHTPQIELTRRGEPVAVLLSIAEYRRLHAGKTAFWDAYQVFRDSTNLAELDIEPDVFDEVRDRSPGREVAW